MPKFKIRHITRYSYEAEARDSANQIMLYPIKDDYQEIVEHNIKVTGDPFVETYLDYYNNIVGTFTYTQPHTELTIDSHLVVKTSAREMPAINISDQEQWKILEEKRYPITYIDFLKNESFDSFPEIKNMIDEIRAEKSSPLETTQKVCNYIFENFQYKKGVTTVESTPEEIWRIRSGVCQDFAHIMLVMLREMSIPSRYVSGYICPKQKGMRGEGATHAWVEVFLPFYGWVGLDPTNNCLVEENHVRLAVGKNFSDCSPVKGTYRGSSKHKLEVVVSASDFESNQPLDEPRQSVYIIEPVVDSTTNSYRKFQEMQMQQQ